MKCCSVGAGVNSSQWQAECNYLHQELHKEAENAKACKSGEHHVHLFHKWLTCLLPLNLRKSFWLALDLDQPIVNDKWLPCSSLFRIQVTNQFQDLPQQQSKLQLQLDQELHACREIQDCTATLLPFIGQFHFLQSERSLEDLTALLAVTSHSWWCFFPGDCWKLSYRTCRLSQGLSTQQRGILNCDYIWWYKYKVMYHYLSTTVIWWLQVTTPHLRTRMFSSPCRPCRWMRGQHRVFGCWTPRGRKHSRFEAYAQRQQWDTEAAQSDQKDDLSMVWLIELCWSPILQGELCTGSCFNVKLIQSNVWFGKPIDVDGKP